MLFRSHQWMEYKDHLFVSFQKDGEDQRWYQPIGPDPQSLIIECSPACDFRYEYVDQSLLVNAPSSMVVEHEPHRRDYIFRLSDLRELKGNAYSPKRNFIKRCRALNPEVVVLDSSMKQECMAIDERWLATQPKPWPVSVMDEVSALGLTMDHLQDLGLTGIGIRVNGRMEAIAIGGPLNTDTYLLSIQKASRDVVGLYQLIFHEFACHVPAQYTFLNFEEDMGLEPLRRAKESWNPCKYVEKCKIIA